MYPISIGFIVDLHLSVSLTEPSLYESNTSSIFVSFLHMASNMLKKVEQKISECLQTFDSYLSDICHNIN